MLQEKTEDPSSSGGERKFYRPADRPNIATDSDIQAIGRRFHTGDCALEWSSRSHVELGCFRTFAWIASISASDPLAATVTGDVTLRAFTTTGVRSKPPRWQIGWHAGAPGSRWMFSGGAFLFSHALSSTP